MSHVREQWPCKSPQLPPPHLIPRVLRTAAYEKCKTLCGNWNQNRNFLEFLRQVQSQVSPSNSQDYNVEPVPTSNVPPRAVEYSSFQPPSLLDLVQMTCPDPPGTQIGPITYPRASSILGPSAELWALAKYFQASTSRCEQEYGNGLSRSVQALHDFSTSVSTTGNSDFSGSLTGGHKRMHFFHVTRRSRKTGTHFGKR